MAGTGGELAISPTVRSGESWNDINAVINFTNREWDGATDHNPFKGLDLGKPHSAAQTDRKPLPKEVIEFVYQELQKAPDLLAIWTLLDWTGARPSELRLLLTSEVILDHKIPHLIIQEREGRTLKNAWSARTVPLIGDALKVAKEITRKTATDAPLFPRYARMAEEWTAYPLR